MTKNIGEIVYKYTLRNGKLFIHEGEIIERGIRKCVYFKDEKTTVRLPKENEFGICHSNGPSLWLADRDDELARRIFIEYEERGIAELQGMINRRTALINILKGEGA